MNAAAESVTVAPEAMVACADGEISTLAIELSVVGGVTPSLPPPHAASSTISPNTARRNERCSATFVRDRVTPIALIGNFKVACITG